MDFSKLSHNREDLSPTQEKILKAALELFAERGYEGTKTQAIAKRAGFTEKTLFKHFPSKQELFTQTVYPAFLNLMQPLMFGSLQAIIKDEEMSLRDRLKALFKNRLSFMQKHPDQFRLIAQQLLFNPEFRKPFISFWQEQILPSMKPLLEQARASGEIRKLSDDTLLRTIISSVIGYAVHRTILNTNSETNTDKDIDSLVDVLMKGIGNA